MYSHHLQQLFNDAPAFGNAINKPLKQYFEERNPLGWNGCNSRTLQNLLGETVGYSSKRNAYKLLAGLCTLVTNYDHIIINTYYNSINSEEAPDLDMDQITHEFGLFASPPNKVSLNLCHIPKGKSFLRKTLDNTPTLKRLPQIEQLVIKDISHFIRVYKDFPGTAPGDITIFSDIYDIDIWDTLFLLLPHLLEIRPVENLEHSEEKDIYNKKQECVNQFFKTLWEQLTPSPDYTKLPIEITRKVYDTLKLISTNLSELYNFTDISINAFLNNFANARNNSEQRENQDIVNSANSRIKALERDLELEYARKERAMRIMNAFKKTSAEDLQAFTETLSNTPAIELLRATDSRLELKITAPVQYFTPEDLETQNNNSGSDYNRYLKEHPDLKSIINKVFITREYKMLFQNIIILEINNYGSVPLTIRVQQSLENFTEFPNPHIYFYDCWGDAKKEIIKYLNESNYELVLMQMVAAVQTINLAENPTFINKFIDRLINRSEFRQLTHFIVNTPEGIKTMNLRELIKYDKENSRQVELQKAEETIKEATQNTSNRQYTQVEIEDDDANWEETPVPNVTRHINEPVIPEIDLHYTVHENLVREADPLATTIPELDIEGENNETHQD